MSSTFKRQTHYQALGGLLGGEHLQPSLIKLIEDMNTEQQKQNCNRFVPDLI